MVDTLSATTDGAVVSFKNVNVGDTFRIYSGQNVLAEGPSPVSITGLESGIVVGAGALETTRVASGGESDRVALPAFQTRNEIPTNVSGALNEDGSVSGAWDAVKNAKAYLVHYGDANVSDPSQAIYMGYTETTSWTLAAGDVPTLAEGDTLQLFIQAFPVVGEGANDIEKAKFLNENKFGSEWSEPIILTSLLPKTPLAITINGEEQTGVFEVKETSQDEYVTLAEKSPDIVYAVQPNDPESGLVYFFGNIPVDLVKNAGGVVYNRNLLVGATSEWKDFSISGWTAEAHRKEISEYGLSVGDNLVQSIELDNTNSENQGGIRSFIAQYDETDTQINTVSGETIAVGEAGTSTAAMTIAGNAIEVAISIGHSINDHTDTGKYRKRKIANGTNGYIGSFTIAPEDIINK